MERVETALRLDTDWTFSKASEIAYPLSQYEPLFAPSREGKTEGRVSLADFACKSSKREFSRTGAGSIPAEHFLC